MTTTATAFTIFKEIASMPWPTAYGTPLRYRVRYCAGTELYGRWKDEAAQETVKRSHFTRFERVDHETWLRARDGDMNGWADSPAPDALVWYDDER